MGGHSKASSPCVTGMGARHCSRAPACPRDGLEYPTLETGLLKPLPPGRPATKSPSQPCLRAGGVRRERAAGTGGSRARGPSGTARASRGFHPGCERWRGDSSLPVLSRHFRGLSSHSLLPWFLSIHCGLLSSSPPSLSSSFSPSLSLSLFQEGSHSMPSCCLFWFFSSPCPCCWAPALLSPVCIHFPCSASLPALLLSCLKAGGAGAAPSAGRGEPLSRTHGVDQKRLKFSGSGSALDVILIKPRCLVKQ